MKKSRSFITTLFLTLAALLLLAGCQVAMPGDGAYPILKGEESTRSGSYAEYKEVAAYSTEIMELPKDVIDSVISNMKQGSYTMDYNDGEYAGTLKSSNAFVVSETPVSFLSHVMKYEINVVYTGTVRRINPLPIYKEVTTYEIKTMELPKDMVGYIIDSMKSGGYSTNYNDGTYKGRITSVNGSIMSSMPSINSSHLLIYSIKVTYKGKVKREHNLPPSKEVTVYETLNATIPPSMLDTLLHSMSSGTTKNYNDGEYKGQLKSVEARVVNKVIFPNLPGEYKYYIRVTYRGTVYVIE